MSHWSYFALAASLLFSAPAFAGQPAAGGQEKKKDAAEGQAAEAQAAESEAAEGEAELKTVEQQAAYAIGLNIGRNMVRSGLQDAGIDPATIARGIRDAFGGKDPALTDEQLQAALGALQTKMQAAEDKEKEATSDKNAEAGRAFLAENVKREEVKQTESGLQYEVLKSGDGPSPEATDTVVAHYHGTLLDGTVFDSSVKRGEPLEIAVNRVIPGWTEALQLMSVGDKWRLYIPAELAYGERGAGRVIGPNSTLIFEVELLDIKAKSKKKQ